MKNSELTTRQSDNVRSRIAKHATEISQRLIDCVMGELELTSSQLKAADLLLSRTVPTVQSVDVNLNASAPLMSEAQAQERLAAWLTSNPALLAALKDKGTVVDSSTDSTERLEH